MDSIYIIGDVHGCYKTLIALIKKLPKDASICFVGDLIDRGFESKKVIDFVKDNNYYCVIGNHEFAMMNESKKVLDSYKELMNNYWTAGGYGGLETIKSYRRKSFFQRKNYGVDILEHVEWLKTLPYFIEFKNIKDKRGRYLVVTHSHIHNQWKNKNFPDGTKQKNSFYHKILFGRISVPDDTPGIFNIFGHTPVSMPIITKSYANIDTGCVYNFSKEKNNLGVLTALEFPSMKIIQQKNIE